MRKLIWGLAVVVSSVLIYNPAHAIDDAKMDTVLTLGQIFGAAEACGILQKNTIASGKILNGIDNAFTEKSDRMVALYAFTKSAMLSYKEMKDGLTNIKCSDVEKLLNTIDK